MTWVRVKKEKEKTENSALCENKQRKGLNVAAGKGRLQGLFSSFSRRRKVASRPIGKEVTRIPCPTWTAWVYRNCAAYFAAHLVLVESPRNWRSCRPNQPTNWKLMRAVQRNFPWYSTNVQTGSLVNVRKSISSPSTQDRREAIASPVCLSDAAQMLGNWIEFYSARSRFTMSKVIIGFPNKLPAWLLPCPISTRSILHLTTALLAFSRLDAATMQIDKQNSLSGPRSADVTCPSNSATTTCWLGSERSQRQVIHSPARCVFARSECTWPRGRLTAVPL